MYVCVCVVVRSQVEWRARDGDQVAPGQVLGVLRGSAGSILVAERVMLNFMQVTSPHLGTGAEERYEKTRGPGADGKLRGVDAAHWPGWKGNVADFSARTVICGVLEPYCSVCYFALEHLESCYPVECRGSGRGCRNEGRQIVGGSSRTEGHMSSPLGRWPCQDDSPCRPRDM